MRALILIAPPLLVGSFLAGASRAQRARPAPSPPPTTPLSERTRAPTTAARPIARTPAHAPAPRFTPPVLPANDPGVAELVNAPRDPTPAMLQARNEETDRRLEELFGPGLAVAKRDAVRAAQATWMREHQHAVQDYYRGEIDRGELALRIHRNMLVWASQVQAALSPDEYRRYTDLEPGADPYVQLVPPGVQVGAPPPEVP